MIVFRYQIFLKAWPGLIFHTLLAGFLFANTAGAQGVFSDCISADEVLNITSPNACLVTPTLRAKYLPDIDEDIDVIYHPEIDEVWIAIDSRCKQNDLCDFSIYYVSYLGATFFMDGRMSEPLHAGSFIKNTGWNPGDANCEAEFQYRYDGVKIVMGDDKVSIQKRTRIYDRGGCTGGHGSFAGSYVTSHVKSDTEISISIIHEFEFKFPREDAE